jgi:hypothetical protein
MTSTEAVGKPGQNKTISVTIKTPAGIGSSFNVHPHDRVDKTTRTAADHFVSTNQLAAGNYGLAVIRNGVGDDMTAAARLEDYDVIEGDELHLINLDPQVDG